MSLYCSLYFRKPSTIKELKIINTKYNFFYKFYREGEKEEKGKKSGSVKIAVRHHLTSRNKMKRSSLCSQLLLRLRNVQGIKKALRINPRAL